MDRYDVCIIGGGLLGCLIAEKLGQYRLSCLLVEKREDFCLEISKANTSVLYPGYDHKPGTLKSRFAIDGNRRTAQACERLGVPVIRCGSLMAAVGEQGRNVLEKKYRQGKECSLSGLVMMSRKEALALEPSLSPRVHSALFSPDTAVIYPWRLGMAAAASASENGVVIKLRTNICAIRRDNGYILSSLDGKEFFASCIINASGMAAHRIRELLFAPHIRIRLSKADYLVFGKEDNPGLSHVIFYEPEDGGKGITLVPDPNGTILAGASDRPFSAGSVSGPSSSFAASGPYAESEYETSPAGLLYLGNRLNEIFPMLSGTAPIRCFAGLRPNPYEVIPDGFGNYIDSKKSIHSFIIEDEAHDGSFVSLIGIKTPGVTASVPIADYVAGIVLGNRLTDIKTRICQSPLEDPAVSETRPIKPETVSARPFEEKKYLASKDPAYGRVVCCCEQVTEGEIREAVKQGAVSFEGIKLRCGAGMGKCQGSRCRSRSELILESIRFPGSGSTPVYTPDSPENTIPDHAACDVLIIGAGAAGLLLAAELAGLDQSLSILVADHAPSPGGVLNQCLHDGFPVPDTGEMQNGPDYLNLLMKQAEKPGVRFLFRTDITKINETVNTDTDLYVTAEAAVNGVWRTIRSRAAVLACGAVERTAGMLRIPGTRPHGIYTAGEVQRMLNLENRLPGRKAVLIGAGNMGLIMADLMLRKGIEVPGIIEKKNLITASQANISKYLDEPKALLSKELIRLNSTVTRIHGGKNLEGVTVLEQSTQAPGKPDGLFHCGRASGSHAGSGTSEFIPCDALVVAAGLIPDRQLLYDLSRPLSGHTMKRIFLFGNCEHIYTTINAMRLPARHMAENISILLKH